MESEGVGYDVVSILKTVNRLSALALREVEHYRDTHDVSRMQNAADCLREMQEFIGSKKLPWRSLDGLAVGIGEFSQASGVIAGPITSLR